MKPKKRGRRPSTEPTKKKIIAVRFTEDEFNRIKSSVPNASEYIRNLVQEDLGYGRS